MDLLHGIAHLGAQRKRDCSSESGDGKTTACWVHLFRLLLTYARLILRRSIFDVSSIPRPKAPAMVTCSGCIRTKPLSSSMGASASGNIPIFRRCASSSSHPIISIATGSVEKNIVLCSHTYLARLAFITGPPWARALMASPMCRMHLARMTGMETEAGINAPHAFNIGEEWL